MTTTTACPECRAQGAELCTTATGLDHIARTRADAARLRVYKLAASTYVIGTSDIQTAAAKLGISAETHRWGSTEPGMYVRRQGAWRAASEINTPKDAKPGVCFVGRIVDLEKGEADPGLLLILLVGICAVLLGAGIVALVTGGGA